MMPDTERLREFAREQSIANLEQALGNRNQLLGDREQSRIDWEQHNNDDPRAEPGEDEADHFRLRDDRQGRLDREQLCRDISQLQLDSAQERRNTRQQALDETRAIFKLPDQQPHSPSVAPIHRDAIDRARTTAGHAQAALSRALAAVSRAEANAIRAEADE